jgi:hypothetical protein
MKLYPKILVAVVAACFMTAAAFAADASGNWKWTQQGRNGPQETTAKLALKDGKLTGTVTSPRGDAEISDGTFKDGAVAFSVVRDFNGTKIVMKYAGKLEGDTIKGSFERPDMNGGAPTKTDWAATRVIEAKK